VGLICVKPAPTTAALIAETARLRDRVEFIEEELDLTATMIKLANLESDAAAMAHIHQGLDAVQRFLGKVTSPEDRARIAERLERLKTELEGW